MKKKFKEKDILKFTKLLIRKMMFLNGNFISILNIILFLLTHKILV
jgi:hypothetical protein